MSKKLLKKEGIEKKIFFYNLNLDLFPNVEKLFQKRVLVTQFKVEYWYGLPEMGKCLE